MSKIPQTIRNTEGPSRSRGGLETPLQEARWKVQPASRDDHRSELELRATRLEGRLGEAWTLRAEGRFDAALSLLKILWHEASLLPPSCGHLIEEIDVLARKLVLQQAHREVERLLAEVAVHCDSGRVSLAARSLRDAKDRLAKLPKECAGDLAESLLRLDARYQALRRPAVVRFQLLRTAFNSKIAARVGDPRRLARLEQPLSRDVLGNLLDQITVAQGILGSLDPDVVGRGDHEAAAGEFAELREVVLELLDAGAVPPSPGKPGPLERTPAASMPEKPSLSPPGPTSEEKPAFQLSPWAMGSWETHSG